MAKLYRNRFLKSVFPIAGYPCSSKWSTAWKRSPQKKRIYAFISWPKKVWKTPGAWIRERLWIDPARLLYETNGKLLGWREKAMVITENTFIFNDLAFLAYVKYQQSLPMLVKSTSCITLKVVNRKKTGHFFQSPAACQFHRFNCLKLQGLSAKLRQNESIEGLSKPWASCFHA